MGKTAGQVTVGRDEGEGRSSYWRADCGLRARMWQHFGVDCIVCQFTAVSGGPGFGTICGVGAGSDFKPTQCFCLHSAHRPKYMDISVHFGSCIKDWLLCFITFGNSCYHDCNIRTCRERELLVVHLNTFLMSMSVCLTYFLTNFV